MSKFIYDEKIYLLNDTDALKHFNELKNRNQIIYNNELLLYKDLLKEYNKVIDKTAYLLKSINLHTSIEYSIAIKYLIEKGYLSNNLQFKQEEPQKELKSNYGINIISGKGICRNYTDIHNDIMKVLNEYVKKFYCVNGIHMFKGRKHTANHVLNLIKHNDILYGIDLYNACKLYRFIDEFTLKEIAYNSNTKLHYKPYYELITSNTDLEDIKLNLRIFKEESTKVYIKPLIYYDVLLSDTLTYLRKQNNLFMDLHNEIKQEKENISLILKNKK